MELENVLQGLAGGALIGIAAAALFFFNGRIAGISGIVGGVIRPVSGETGWRVAFVVGLLAGGVLLSRLAPSTQPTELTASIPLLVVAGLLVGFGSRLGSGCTSGHGVCGVGRLSPRSISATLTFIATGAITVFISRSLFGALS